METARSQLNGVISTFRRLRHERGLKIALSLLGENKKVLQKWSINFIGHLILSGGGQRPQVFCQLQLPRKTEIAEMRRRAEEGTFIELRTVIEKTTRAFDMPNVVFPSNVLQFIEFHTEIIRPVLLKNIGIRERELEEKTLLIDTRSGDPLSSQQVANTFKRFLYRIDPELTKVTPMALRGSYATMMLQAYRAGQVFKELSENAFLEFLAKGMNTSVEQLAGTYAGNNMSDFEYCARELTSVLAQLDGGEASEHPDQAKSVDAARCLWS